MKLDTFCENYELSQSCLHNNNIHSFDNFSFKKNKIKFWKIRKLYLIESCSKPRSFDQSVIIRLEKQSKLKTNKPYFLKMRLLFLVFENTKVSAWNVDLWGLFRIFIWWDVEKLYHQNFLMISGRRWSDLPYPQIPVINPLRAP